MSSTKKPLPHGDLPIVLAPPDYLMTDGTSAGHLAADGLANGNQEKQQTSSDNAHVIKLIEKAMTQPDLMMSAQQRHERYYKESNRRVSRWEDDYDSKRRSGWGDETEKVFTPQTFSFVPPHYTINEYEIWISK